MAGGEGFKGGSHCFQGGKGRRISCRRQSKKWDCRELTANLLPTSNEGKGGRDSGEDYIVFRGEGKEDQSSPTE